MPNFSVKTPLIFPPTIPIIETGDLVLGGVGNGPNRADEPLKDRTDFLKKAFDDLVLANQGLVIGEDVQAWDVFLDALAALNGDGLLRKSGNGVSTITRWVDNSIACGRLSLETNKPFSNLGVASDRVFYTPFTGNTIALVSSGEWRYFTFAELSFPLTGIANGKNVDVFAAVSGQNVGLSLDQWTNDTTRATLLARVDGVWVAANNSGRRYLGTLRTTALAECTDSEAKRLLWNAHNQQAKSLLRRENGGSWTYSGTAWRPMNGSLLNRVEFVSGTNEASISARVVGVATGNGQLALALNSTVNAIENYGYGMAADSQSTTVGSWVESVPQVGFNYIQAVERAQGSPATFNPTFTAISSRWMC